jgi:hypothetical protein
MKSILFLLEYIYQYLFYRLYRMGILINIPFKKINRLVPINLEFHVSLWSAAALTILVMLNLTTFFLFLFSKYLSSYSESKPIWIILFFLVFIINCIYFLKGKKYLEIENRFSNETIVGKLLSFLFLLLIIFLTFLPEFHKLIAR